MELHVLPVSVWIFSSFLPQSKNIQIAGRLIGDSQLAVGVKQFLSLYFDPAYAFDLYRLYPASHPMSAEIYPQRISGKDNGWLD